MNKWIQILNFVGGCIFAIGSLWFINGSIQQSQISLDAAMCSMNQNCSPSILSQKSNLAKVAGGDLGFFSTVATLGAGLACLRASKN